MSEIQIKHLVIVRHGESEGDVRRAMNSQPLSHSLSKHPRDEEETKFGQEQSLMTGNWIAKYVLGTYGIESFDRQLVSPLIRTKQSAQSLGLPGEWQEDERLTERDRGTIQGMTKKQHQTQYPDSYRQMQEYPFHWSPLDGESLLRVSVRFAELVNEFMESDISTAVFMTHRDLMWSAHVPLDNMPLEEVEHMDTDYIRNGQVFHYTNLNPKSAQADGRELAWKRSVTPWGDTMHEQSSDWTKLPV